MFAPFEQEVGLCVCVRPGVSKPQPAGQIWPRDYFYPAHKLRMVFTFLSG